MRNLPTRLLVIRTMKNILRIVIGTAVLLLIPLIAMQFIDGMDWDLTDFIVMGALLLGTGLVYELIARKLTSTKSRIITGVVLLVVFLLIWADLAVGIFNIPGFSGS